MSWLTQIFSSEPGRGKDERPRFDAPLAPAERIAVVGDVHGNDRLLISLLNRLGGLDPAPDRLVFVGDLVDRGENSANVLSLLFGLQRRLGRKMVVLRGNHEQMMLDFLDTPTLCAARWLRHGGLQTLASFGIGGAVGTLSGEQANHIRDRLAEAMGAAMIDWLWETPSRFSTGNVHVVHAAADPRVPMTAQSADTLTWGHPDFFRRARSDGQWVVHGHTIVGEVVATEGRIGVDTGAFATGRLSAVCIGPGTLDVISVPDPAA
ncbi:MAG: serine/threonine protein phosphatase [Rhodobacterales bacterium]|nr:MAG: serine/threonine protein phosphatase [Rhodobacterales bacterium]